MAVPLFSSRWAHSPAITRAAFAACTISLTGCALAGPSHSVVGNPPLGLRAQAVAFPSGSGSVIRAWFIPGRARAGAVLLLHGMGSNRTSMLARAEFLQRQGFAVLAPDFRAHGESTGEQVTFGARESLDAAAALGYLQRAAPGERIGVIGVSMGGAATLLGPEPLDVNAVVLESVYPTIRRAVSDRLATWFGPLSGVGRLFTSTALGLLRRETGVAEAELEPIGRIGRLRAPLLLIAGTDDRYTPLAEAESLFARAPAPKSFWSIEGAGHEDLHAFTPAEYQWRVGGFLSRLLRQEAVVAPSDTAARTP
jgi:pimeloyl-ACP methyl ester carboxylesterase